MEHEALPSVDARAPLPGAIIADKYRLEQLIASGGMGSVFVAHHLLLDQPVAIKFVLPGGGRDDVVTRFVREARATVTLQGEHIVRVMDVATLDNGAPYMVMEYLRGADLRSELNQRGPLPADEAAEYVLQACEALAEAHVRGIVHRDVKPSNLFLTRRLDGSACIKVLDFGISKLVRLDAVYDAELTSTRMMLGSPHYMSPEQLRDARLVDERCDIWGLGITLYELLTGNVPFEGETIPSLSAKIAADPPVPLRDHRPELAEALGDIVMRCLEKQPSARYASVAELALALARFAPPQAALSVERAVAITRERRGAAVPSPQAAPRVHTQAETMAEPQPPVPRQHGTVTTLQSPDDGTRQSPAPEPIAGERAVELVAVARSGNAERKRRLRTGLLIAGAGAALVIGYMLMTRAAPTVTGNPGLAEASPAVTQPARAQQVIPYRTPQDDSVTSAVTAPVDRDPSLRAARRVPRATSAQPASPAVAPIAAEGPAERTVPVSNAAPVRVDPLGDRK